MKFNDIKGLDVKELRKKVLESRKQLLDLKLKNSMGRLEDPSQIKVARRGISKLLTAISQKV